MFSLHILYILKLMVLNGYALQRPGTNKEMLSLMHQMAQDSKLPPAGYCGTILFDEMSIQVSNREYRSARWARRQIYLLPN